MYPALGLASLVLVFILVISILHGLYMWYRLCHIPGPFWGAFASCWDPQNGTRGQWTLDLSKASDIYGNPISSLFGVAIGN